MTKFVKKSEVKNNWYEIDAKNAVVGRLATVISKIIRGKNKTNFTPHMDNGDFVVVKNIEQIKFTGKKFQNKKEPPVFDHNKCMIMEEELDENYSPTD